ncbi:hypothetical protein BZL30_0060 [Mycobacterium kansasii]|uniref:Probable transcriptional regulatory protein BZL30_0060 n=3 Tax=cellular organisms TaxID=131567 RepID=A0A1V3XU85_MYCKA|nr:hypothetical protein BZL30_0060 [Mycobacterium kansasii]
MSGHSKWATTKHKKAVVDARRGKMFARLIKNIEVAARVGGGDPAGNPTLYDAIQKAKKSSVPNENIERARKRGAGEEAGGADWQTIMYEGYAPNGVAVLIECLTDNRNRAASEVRVAMTRNGGTMADPGSVSYLFSRKGVVTLDKDGLTEDDVLTAVLDAGAEEVNDLGDTFEVVAEPGDLVAVRTALQDAGLTTNRPKPVFSRRSVCRWMSMAPARCSSSSTLWKTATTCRTCGPMSTCPTRCWRLSTRSERGRRSAAPPEAHQLELHLQPLVRVGRTHT